MNSLKYKLLTTNAGYKFMLRSATLCTATDSKICYTTNEKLTKNTRLRQDTEKTVSGCGPK